jgi:hypothetical protein
MDLYFTLPSSKQKEPTDNTTAQQESSAVNSTANHNDA